MKEYRTQNKLAFKIGFEGEQIASRYLSEVFPNKLVRKAKLESGCDYIVGARAPYIKVEVKSSFRKEKK